MLLGLCPSLNANIVPRTEVRWMDSLRGRFWSTTLCAMLGKGLQPSEVKNRPIWKIYPCAGTTVLAGFCYYFGKNRVFARRNNEPLSVSLGNLYVGRLRINGGNNGRNMHMWSSQKGSFSRYGIDLLTYSGGTILIKSGISLKEFPITEHDLLS